MKDVCVITLKGGFVEAVASTVPLDVFVVDEDLRAIGEGAVSRVSASIVADAATTLADAMRSDASVV